MTAPYCLIVLRTIRGGDEEGFVPNLAVSVGMVLAIGGIGVLIFFIHHIASSIQASSIITSVADETLLAVERLFPGKLGQGLVTDEEDQASLSPGVNDVTTAVTCLDYLTAILTRLASRNIPSSHRFEEGKLRVIAIRPTFASLAAESFDQIRESAKGNVAIMLRMLGALQTIASQTASPSRRLVLREQTQQIAELAARTIASPHDQARFESRLASARAALDAEPSISPTKKSTKP